MTLIEQLRIPGDEVFSTRQKLMIADEIERMAAERDELREFVEEVRRTGDTRLASMAIGVLSK